MDINRGVRSSTCSGAHRFNSSATDYNDDDQNNSDHNDDDGRNSDHDDVCSPVAAHGGSILQRADKEPTKERAA